MHGQKNIKILSVFVVLIIQNAMGIRHWLLTKILRLCDFSLNWKLSVNVK